MDAMTQSPWVPIGIILILVVGVWLILRSKTSRIIKYDVNTLTTVIFLAAILFLINAIPITMHQLALGNMRIPLEGRKDFTQNQRNSLSKDTIDMLRKLNFDVTATAFYYHGRPEEQAATDLFSQYQFYTPHFKYKMVDPVTDLQAALKYKEELRFINPQQATIIPGTVILEAAQPEGATPRRVSVVLPTQGKPGEAEEKLTNGLLQLMITDKKTVYFTTGHGERTPDDPKSQLDRVKDSLEKSQYIVKTLSLYKEGKVPGDASVVIVCGPQTDFSKQEIDSLRTWVNAGNSLCVMLDPPKQYPVLQAFLDEEGLDVGNDIILDPGRGFNHNPLFPMVARFSKNSPITSGYDVEDFFQAARSVSPAAKLPPNVTVDIIARTLDEAWALKGVDKGLPGGSITYDPKRDQKGPIGVAGTSVIKVQGASPSASPSASPAASPTPPPKEGRVVVYGCSSFIAGQMYMLVGNGDLFLRSMNWLAQREGHISEHAAFTSPPLVLDATQKWRVWWISMFLIPGGLAMIGLLVHMFFKPN